MFLAVLERGRASGSRRPYSRGFTSFQLCKPFVLGARGKGVRSCPCTRGGIRPGRPLAGWLGVSGFESVIGVGKIIVPSSILGQKTTSGATWVSGYITQRFVPLFSGSQSLGNPSVVICSCGCRIGRYLGVKGERLGNRTMRSRAELEDGDGGEGKRRRTGWEVGSGGRKSRHARYPDGWEVRSGVRKSRH